MQHLRYRSHAKINLFLEVVARREDGFHDIETIFQTIRLYDELTLEPTEEDIALTCTLPELPVDESNLVWRAAELLKKETGCSRGVRIHLEKHLPVASGLAGGSGNAAAALVGLNRLWALGLDMSELARIALHLGSDVPYCLTGGTALATGRGEVLSRLPQLDETWLVLLHPPFGVTAKEAYTHPLLRQHTQSAGNSPSAGLSNALEALTRREWRDVLFNRLELPVFDAYPELQEGLEALKEAGCTACLMSGSGSTLFGVCETKDHAYDVVLGELPFAASVVPTTSDGVVLLEEW